MNVNGALIISFGIAIQNWLAAFAVTLCFFVVHFVLVVI